MKKRYFFPSPAKVRRRELAAAEHELDGRMTKLPDETWGQAKRRWRYLTWRLLMLQSRTIHHQRYSYGEYSHPNTLPHPKIGSA